MRFLLIQVLSLLLLATPCFAIVDFTGDADCIGIAGVLDDITLTEAWTVCAWMNGDANDGYVWSFGDNVGTSEYCGFQVSTGNVAKLASNGHTAESGSAMSTGTWYHVCVTFDGSDFEIFLDGDSDYTQSDDGIIWANIDNAKIGCVHNSGSPKKWFNGEITDVAIWSTQLSDAEIELLADSRVKRMPLQVSPGSLKAYYPLDEVADGTAGIGSDSFKDYSGNENDGTGTDTDDDSVYRGEKILTYP
jgi:hypothetical protein